MERRIKIYTVGRNGLDIKETSLEEANAILKETFADSVGGLVTNKRTGEVISEIGPDVQEILILDAMLGGG